MDRSGADCLPLEVNLDRLGVADEFVLYVSCNCPHHNEFHVVRMCFSPTQLFVGVLQVLLAAKTAG